MHLSWHNKLCVQATAWTGSDVMVVFYRKQMVNITQIEVWTILIVSTLCEFFLVISQHAFFSCRRKPDRTQSHTALKGHNFRLMIKEMEKLVHAGVFHIISRQIRTEVLLSFLGFTLQEWWSYWKQLLSYFSVNCNYHYLSINPPKWHWREHCDDNANKQDNTQVNNWS